MSLVTGRTTCGGTRTRDVGEVVDDEWSNEPRDEPCDVPRHSVARRRRSSPRQAVSRATCRGTQTCGVGEVVDDEPAQGGVVADEPARRGVVNGKR
jgi:hypothetical protein